jgi:HD-GYP domain-containing protein (c-di-GMP phosphodiesterase class II)
MIKHLHVSPIEMIMALSTAMDLVSSRVVDHQKRVAHIAALLAEKLELPRRTQLDVILAGALHDVGAFSLAEKLSAIDFDLETFPLHAERGFHLLKGFAPFESVAPLVLYHHTQWRQGEGAQGGMGPVPFAAHVLHLADRVEVLVDREQDILDQAEAITARVVQASESHFHPQVVQAFAGLAQADYFWLDLISPSIDRIMGKRLERFGDLALDSAGVAGLARIFSKIIDFRCPFTASHSTGVAAVAKTLGQLIGFSSRECAMLEVAGYLHDLGKIAIPSEILNKPGKLTATEYNIVKRHAYHTYHALDHITGFETINAWASFHHERLDGDGYPFRHRGSDLSLGARVMATADVFTAITEDRPYRPGMPEARVRAILMELVEQGKLDWTSTTTLLEHYEQVNTARIAAQGPVLQEYAELISRTGTNPDASSSTGWMAASPSQPHSELA